jgi:transposase
VERPGRIGFPTEIQEARERQPNAGGRRKEDALFYSEKFKRKMVQRMLMPGGPSATALSSEVNIPQSTLSRWVREWRRMGQDRNKEAQDGNPESVMSKRPEDWEWEEKVRVVMEARGKKGQELGAFLRKEGIHEVQLRDWEMGIRGGLNKRGRKPSRNPADVKRVKALERELRRKEKALAETAALLVLKKKVDAIWGDVDDGTKGKKEK